MSAFEAAKAFGNGQLSLVELADRVRTHRTNLESALFALELTTYLPDSVELELRRKIAERIAAE